jgi:hypothetical protein
MLSMAACTVMNARSNVSPDSARGEQAALPLSATGANPRWCSAGVNSYENGSPGPRRGPRCKYDWSEVGRHFSDAIEKAKQPKTYVEILKDATRGAPIAMPVTAFIAGAMFASGRRR